MRISFVVVCLGFFLTPGGGGTSGVLAATVAAAEPVTAGRFSILSMNVAGLPQILQNNDVPGDKTTNAKTIGSLFAAYDFDVIHVQEVGRRHGGAAAGDTYPGCLQENNPFMLCCDPTF